MITSAILALIGVIATAIFTLRSDANKNGPDWFSSLSDRVDDLFGQVEKLQNQVTRLNAKVSGLETFKAAAVRYIRHLRSLIRDEHLPPVPDELKDEIEE